jgi:Uma2 family endonuclease
MAIALTPPRPVTDEDLLEFSRRNPGYQFERTAKGELVVTPTGSESGRRSAELLGQLYSWNQLASTGLVFDSSTGFRLPDGAVFSPDASWIQRARWEALTPTQRQGFAPLCPDVVFEIRSESDSLSDVRTKMGKYLANGARLGVLIDPHSRIVELSRPGRPLDIVETFQNPRTVPLDPELPGFVLDLRAIFSRD